MRDQNLIDGSFVPARSGATDDVLDPATGEVMGRAPASGAEDVDAAVAAARAAGLSGRPTPCLGRQART